MAAIEILKGPKAGKQLTLDTVNKCLKEGFYMVNRYPISEISQAEEIDTVGKHKIVDIHFGAGLVLNVKIKRSDYNKLKEAIHKRETEPRNIEVPVTANDNTDLIAAGIGGVIVLSIILAAIFQTSKPKNIQMPNKQEWSNCMNHPHWKDFRKEKGYLETLERKFMICGDEP